MKTIKNTIILALTLFTMSCTNNETLQELESRKSFKAVYDTVNNTIIVNKKEVFIAWDYVNNKPIQNQLVSVWSDKNHNWIQFITSEVVTDITINGEYYNFTNSVTNTYSVKLENFDNYINFELIYLNE